MSSKLIIKDLLSLGVVTLVMFLATVATTAWIWCYNSGFLAHHGIDIGEVDFSVVLSDYVVTIYGLMASSVVIVIIRTSSLLGDKLGRSIAIPFPAAGRMLSHWRLRGLDSGELLSVGVV